MEQVCALYKKRGGMGVLKSLDYYQNQVISLNLEQQEALNVTLPAVLSGVAGSGKSVVALSMIAQYLESKNPKYRHRALYLSRSTALVKQNKLFWKSLPIVTDCPHTVDFISYEALIEEALATGLMLVDEPFFNEWTNTI